MIGLAARLRLGGAGAPRRYFAWGQAVRNAVLGVMLAHAVWGLASLALFARSRHLIGWLPPPPAAASGRCCPRWYATGYAWIVVFIALLLADYRTARVLAVLVVADAASVLQHAVGGRPGVAVSNWAYWRWSTSPRSWRWPRSTGTPRRFAAGPGCWRFPRGTCWCPCRCCGRAVRPRRLGAGRRRAVLPPAHRGLPVPRGEGLVRPRRHRRVVPGPAVACRRHRAVPAHLAARSPHDPHLIMSAWWNCSFWRSRPRWSSRMRSARRPPRPCHRVRTRHTRDDGTTGFSRPKRHSNSSARDSV